jgi:hypothetical protein
MVRFRRNRKTKATAILRQDYAPQSRWIVFSEEHQHPTVFLLPPSVKLNQHAMGFLAQKKIIVNLDTLSGNKFVYGGVDAVTQRYSEEVFYGHPKAVERHAAGQKSKAWRQGGVS